MFKILKSILQKQDLKIMMHLINDGSQISQIKANNLILKDLHIQFQQKMNKLIS